MSARRCGGRKSGNAKLFMKLSHTHIYIYIFGMFGKAGRGKGLSAFVVPFSFCLRGPFRVVLFRVYCFASVCSRFFCSQVCFRVLLFAGSFIFVFRKMPACFLAPRLFCSPNNACVSGLLISFYTIAVVIQDSVSPHRRRSLA